jgi:hypothetical protein
VAPRLDTIALVDRASGPRQIGTRRAIALVIALCLATGLGTYLVRSRWSAAKITPTEPGASSSGAAAPAAAGPGSTTEPGATGP